MKKIFLLLLLFMSIKSYSQQNDEPGKKAVLEKVNKFFEALEKKDTVLYKRLAFTNAQIWVSRSQQDSVKTSIRYISDDISMLAVMKDVIEESPMKIEINIHDNIAVVWAPYTLSVSGKFSHCGIDVFTLLKTTEGWKIVSCVYSVEPDGCNAIKKEYHIN